MDSVKLPEGWHTAYDARYQRWYYFNPSTGVTQWTPPDSAQTAPVATNDINENDAYGIISATTDPQSRKDTQHAADRATAATAQATAADASKPSAHPAATAKPKQQNHSSFQYYDPQGNLLGPFSVQQLRAWRPFLPLDLVLLRNVQGNSNFKSSSSGSGGGDSSEKNARSEAQQQLLQQNDQSVLAGNQQQQQQQQQEEEHAQVTTTTTAEEEEEEPAAECPTQQQAGVSAASNTCSPQTSQPSQPAAAAVTKQPPQSQLVDSVTNISPTSQAADIAGTSAACIAHSTVDKHSSSSNSSSSNSSSRIMLADLLGDSHLLAAWRSAQQQQQRQQQWPPKAIAPPAPIVESWYSSCYNSSSSSSSSHIPTAATAQHASWHTMHDNAHQQHYATANANATAAATPSSTNAPAGFNKYAAAVLQGLPPDDEAVQLARMAAAHGYTLQDVLQQQQQQRNASGNAQPNAPPGVLLTKDPRSGRLTAAAAGSSGGAAELYGDLMRWCNPMALEQQLARRAKKKQKV